MSEQLVSGGGSYLIPREVDGVLPSAVKRALRDGGTNLQDDFLSEFRRKRKSTGVAYLLWFFLGWHYAYLGKWGVQLLYWITAGGFLIWALVDLFRLAGVVKNTNADIAVNTMRDLRAVAS